MNTKNKNTRPLIIYYQPPTSVPQPQPQQVRLHPVIYIFLGLVVIVAMASVIAAIVVN